MMHSDTPLIPASADALKEALEQERLARQAAETQLEETARELSQANEELRLNQAKLIQSEKMASLGQLAAGVAHEINNPISFVMNNLVALDEYSMIFKGLLVQYQEMLRLQRAGETDSMEVVIGSIQMIEQEEDIDHILADLDILLKESSEGINRVKDIVINLKSFARIDEAEEKEADINECLESALKIVWNELKYKCIVERDMGELPKLWCYPGQLNQVFMNLLINAAQAIPEKGRIGVRSRFDNGNIVISIQDSGSGIPEEQLSKIFNPFFTTKPPGKGTGLGLSIVYSIIETHEGNIEVDSVQGQGTTFTITLPLREREGLG
ncbi:MAG: sensor histidine kinase [Candidatus Melainabacteria bacterium]